MATLESTKEWIVSIMTGDNTNNLTKDEFVANYENIIPMIAYDLGISTNNAEMVVLEIAKDYNTNFSKQVFGLNGFLTEDITFEQPEIKTVSDDVITEYKLVFDIISKEFPTKVIKLVESPQRYSILVDTRETAKFLFEIYPSINFDNE